MFRQTRKKWFKALALKVLIVHLIQVVNPLQLAALTTGPMQPEFIGFQSAANSEMVNLFTGDFSYNIPLLDIEGYPVNLFYNANVQMNEEASWTGLGWNLNVGSVNRMMRGIPDDFDGEEIEVTKSVLPNLVSGNRSGYGVDALFYSYSWGTGDFTSSYKGPGTEAYFNSAISLGVPILPDWIPFVKWPVRSHGYGLTANSQTGITQSPSYGFGYQQIYGTAGIGFSKHRMNTETSYFNSRSGLTSTSMMHNRSWNAGIDLSYVSMLFTGGFSIPIYVGVGSGSNGGTTVSMGTHTYPMAYSSSGISSGFSTSNSRGATLAGMASAYKSSMSYTNLNASVMSENVKAYGYFNLEDAVHDEGGQFDYNREFNTIYMADNMPFLSPSQNTMDLFSASAQGVSGVFRPFRYDVGQNSDPIKYNIGASLNTFSKKLHDAFWLFTPVAPLFLVATDRSSGKSHSFTWAGSGKWGESKGNNISNAKFRNEVPNLLFNTEKVYFKNTGEKTEFNPEMLNSYGGIDATNFIINEVASPKMSEFLNHQVSDNVWNKSYSQTAVTFDYQSDRQPRNQLFSYLSASEAEASGIFTDIKSYVPFLGTSGVTSSSSIDRDDSYRSENHMSEIEIAQPDGGRYIYSHPAYNKSQKTVTFNISGTSKDYCKNLVGYDESTDNTITNDNGRDHLFYSEEIPSYAHSVLLSAVLSPDYSDLSGNGISDDDLGSYTKFNYTKAADYKWRIPYSAESASTSGYPKASFNENFKTDDQDDVAQYMYGEREQWYLHSIESKNFIAEFYVSDRNDALGVTGENGGKDSSNKLKKLDKIELYSKEDREINGSNAVPIKVIEFEYDYSLCEGVPNQVSSGAGKLTLKKVFISGGTSKRGKLSPYEFSYNDNANQNNYDYNEEALDRWGNYKPASCSIPNSEFPYSEQNATLADAYARAWKLHQIKTPAGSLIKITYESDDYAYVQDKQAMNMMKIVGFGSTSGTPTLSTQANLFESTGYDITQYNSFNRMFVQIDNSVSSTADFYDRYLHGVMESSKYLYFKCAVDLNHDDAYEYVNGYCSVTNYGIVESGGNKYGYLDIKPVPINDPEPEPEIDLNTIAGTSWSWMTALMPGWSKKRIEPEPSSTFEKINPIAKAGWQFTKLHLPELIYPVDISTCQSTANPKKCLDDVIANFGYDIDAITNGEHVMLKNRDFSSLVDLNRSWVRLDDSDGIKKGGGARVSKIEITDNWSEMSTTGAESVYGMTYEYKLEDGSSSGVASYEPMIGNDENPLRTPVFYDKKNLLLPDDHHYQEMPVGESFYPQPVVGYSKVTVSPLTYENVTKHAMGYEEYEFYTAKDFPILVDHTRLSLPNKFVEQTENSAIDDFAMEDRTLDLLAASQGYTIQVNDMHGMPAGKKSYAAIPENKLVSSVIFEYKTEVDEASQRERLSNTAQVLRSDLTLESALIGMDADVFIDTRAAAESNLDINSSTSWSIGLNNSYNHNSGLSSSLTEFKSIVLTKLISRYGILEKVTSTVEDKTTVKEDLAWNPETGAVLLSKVQNEFNDPIYVLMQPAYWKYSQMGPAYLNRDAFGMNVSVSSGGIVNLALNPSAFFMEGDEVSLFGATGRCWVADVDDVNDQITLITRDGNAVPTMSSTNIRVVRSARRNTQSLPLQTLTTKKHPILSSGDVLDATAFEYSDEWSFHCEDLLRCQTGASTPECSYNITGVLNPYVRGTKGQWRLSKHLYYDGLRDAASFSSNENVRTNGTYASFNKYWTNSGPIWSITSSLSNWRTASLATKYDPNGNLIESKDANGNLSASVFGYNHYSKDLLIASAYNASYRQIGFDGFEDYSSQPSNQGCGYDDHFSFRDGTITTTGTAEISAEESHTGKYSMKVYWASITLHRHTVGCESSELPEINVCPVVEPEEESIENANNECTGVFEPNCGYYTISGWVKGVGSIKVAFKDAGGTELLSQGLALYSSDVTSEINEWKKLEGTFVIGPGVDCMEISFNNWQPNVPAYFDDIRVHPVNATMTSYVYDAETLRLMATLDANNFATFIEYSNEGVQIRTKQETTQGIITRSENYSSLVK